MTRELCTYLIDIANNIDEIDNTELRKHIKTININAKKVLSITDKKIKVYVNRKNLRK